MPVVLFIFFGGGSRWPVVIGKEMQGKTDTWSLHEPLKMGS